MDNSLLLDAWSMESILLESGQISLEMEFATGILISAKKSLSCQMLAGRDHIIASLTEETSAITLILQEIQTDVQRS